MGHSLGCALRQLGEQRLIQDVGTQGEIFRLTDVGYDVADVLGASEMHTTSPGAMDLYLPTDVRNLLLQHVPQPSGSYEALRNSAEIKASRFNPNEHRISCNQQDVDVFFDTARKRFPERVREIEQAYLRIPK